MSYFDDLMSEGEPQLAEAYARTGVVYRASNCEDTPLAQAEVHKVTASQIHGERGTYNEYLRLVSISTDPQGPDYSGISSVSLDGQFVIDGVAWSIAAIRMDRPERLVCECTRTIASQVSAGRVRTGLGR